MGKLSDRFADPDPGPAPAELDAIRADDAASAASSEPAAPHLPVPGDQFHVLVSGFTIHTKPNSFTSTAAVLDRGATVTVTDDLIEASRDRFGNLGWPAILHDPEAQVRRWGRVHIAPGPAPAGLQRWEYGDARWADDRARARATAWAETDPDERARKLGELERVYGPAALTSKTTAVFRPGEHPTERQARAQDEEFARARARGER
jgi:hypothetical protein